MSLLAALVIGAGLLMPSPRVLQVPQGTTNCTAVSWWFADASTRLGSRAVKPILTLYNGQATSQMAKITTRPNTVASGTTEVTLAPVTRAQFDLSQLVNGAADFAVEVEFSGIGAADLKMVGSVAVASSGLPLCR